LAKARIHPVRLLFKGFLTRPVARRTISGVEVSFPTAMDRNGNTTSVMALGVGSFAFSVTQTLKENGADVCTYLTRDYAHFPPSLAGPTFLREAHPSPVALIKERGVELVVPQSIDWAQAPWAEDLLSSGVGLLCATGEAMRIERERDFARKLCADFGIPFPASHVAQNRLAAEQILARHPAPYVIKNPLCSPTSPVHTVLCETVAETHSWLQQVDYAEGVFLQEFAGRAEAGHIALISGGEIYSLVTNQEYKRAFNGNLGIVAGAPLGGLVEVDPGDKYGLARELIHPLRPWLRAVNFHGPLQVTAVKRRGQWCVIEYNIRIGVTSGAMILRLLKNPLETLLRTARNEKLTPEFGVPPSGGPRAHPPEGGTPNCFGASVTLAGYGYPFTQIKGPPVPLEIVTPLNQANADVWWSEVERSAAGKWMAAGHRLGDFIGYGPDLPTALARAYENIHRVRSPGSYYRTDIGQSLWPPGNE
jgi:phosphoribosylamine--glycine ligase